MSKVKSYNWVQDGEFRQELASEVVKYLLKKKSLDKVNVDKIVSHIKDHPRGNFNLPISEKDALERCLYTLAKAMDEIHLKQVGSRLDLTVKYKNSPKYLKFFTLVLKVYHNIKESGDIPDLT